MELDIAPRLEAVVEKKETKDDKVKVDVQVHHKFITTREHGKSRESTGYKIAGGKLGTKREDMKYES